MYKQLMQRRAKRKKKATVVEESQLSHPRKTLVPPQKQPRDLNKGWQHAAPFLALKFQSQKV